MIAVPPSSIVATPRLPLTRTRRWRLESSRGPWGERGAARIAPRLPRPTSQTGTLRKGPGGPFGSRQHVRVANTTSHAADVGSDVEAFDELAG